MATQEYQDTYEPSPNPYAQTDSKKSLLNRQTRTTPNDIIPQFLGDASTFKALSLVCYVNT